MRAFAGGDTASTIVEINRSPAQPSIVMGIAMRPAGGERCDAKEINSCAPLCVVNENAGISSAQAGGHPFWHRYISNRRKIVLRSRGEIAAEAGRMSWPNIVNQRGKVIKRQICIARINVSSSVSIS